MKFKTHELPKKYKSTKKVKIMLAICAVMWAFILIFATVAIALEIHNFIKPFCLIMLPFLLLGGIFAVELYDMKRAFVEIDTDKIIAVDYYFGIKREKVFLIKDIITVEIISGYSMKVQGYRFSGQGFGDLKYLVFRGKKNQYLFKLICSEETKNYVEKHFEVMNT